MAFKRSAVRFRLAPPRFAEGEACPAKPFGEDGLSPRVAAFSYAWRGHLFPRNVICSRQRLGASPSSNGGSLDVVRLYSEKSCLPGPGVHGRKRRSETPHR